MQNKPASSDPETLAGRTALVTGAAKRIGACTVRELHAQGCDVVFTYRGSVAEAHALSDALNAERPGSVRAVRADLADTATLPAIVGAAVDAYGRLDLLINNASAFYPTPLGGITEAHWDDLFASNLKAPLFLAQAAAPHLRATEGAIVNMVDIHARQPLREHTVYCAAKAGLAMLTLSLARELGPEVRVNGIAPGPVLWPESGLDESAQASIIRRTALKRPGAPADIAGLIVYLVRDATYVTGQIIAVDGGRSLGW